MKSLRTFKALRLLKKFVSISYWWIGIISIGLGVVFLLRYGMDSFSGSVDARIELPIPFTNYRIPILPPSAIMLGFFLILMERKYEWRALPLLLMCAGAFDFIWNRDAITIIANGDWWAFLQLGLVFGGWVVAGRPRFDFNIWFVIALLLFSVTNVTYNQPFELGIYLFVYTSSRFKAKSAGWSPIDLE